MASPPPAGAKVALAKPLAFELRVVKPSGAPVPEARVEIEWDFTNPYDDVEDVVTLATDAAGKADVLVLDPGEWLSKTEATGTLRVSKPHHGPVVERAETFENKAARVRVKYEPEAPSPVQVLELVETEEVRWGRPRVIGKNRNILEVTLVEGGMLGEEFASIPTRKLDATTTPTSQIDQELLFHVAHGDVALDRSTDFVFEHDLSADECVPGQCKIMSVGTVSSNDPTFTAAETDFDQYKKKVSVRNAVFGGLRAGNVHEFEVRNSQPLAFKFGGTQTTNLNPRNVVGIVRLARQLVTERQARVLLTSGFLRTYSNQNLVDFNNATALGLTAGMQAPESGRLKRDAHGRGRAVDFSGLLLDHPSELQAPKGVTEDKTDPNVTLKTTTKPYAAQRDFLVFVHWGGVEMLFENAASEKQRGRSSQEFRNDFNPGAVTKRIFYRLENINSPFDPADPASIPKRKNGHELTPAHYEDAAQIFLEVYQFFCKEYSHENEDLGSNGKERSTHAPGEVAGFVIHPDYPRSSSRSLHQDHIHANLGHNGPSIARGEPPAPNKLGPRLGVWASNSEISASVGKSYEF